MNRILTATLLIRSPGPFRLYHPDRFGADGNDNGAAERRGPQTGVFVPCSVNDPASTRLISKQSHR